MKLFGFKHKRGLTQINYVCNIPVYHVETHRTWGHPGGSPKSGPICSLPRRGFLKSGKIVNMAGG